MSGLFVGEVPPVTCIHGTRLANADCRRCERARARLRLDRWAVERRNRRIRRAIDLVCYAVLWLGTAYLMAHWLVAMGVGRP